jgi:hypothetical protein
MGRLSDPNGIVDANLQLFLLGKIKNATPSSLVPVNAVIDDIREAMPSCQLSDQQLARLVKETAMLLGHMPVFDPSRLEGDHDEVDRNHRGHHRRRSATHSVQSNQH